MYEKFLERWRTILWWFPVLVLCGCLNFDGGGAPSPSPDPGPDRRTPVPAITEKFTGDEADSDGNRVGAIAKSFAVIVGDNESVVLTTADVRAAWVRSGRLFLDTRMRGKHPGLAEAIESHLKAAIGTKVVPLDDELRAKAVKAFQEIHQSCEAVQ